MDNKSLKKRGLFWGVVSILAMTLSSGIQADTEKLSLQIKSQKIGPAMMELAAKTNTQIVVSREVGDSLQLPAIQGEYTLSGALEEMLKGSNLAYEFISADSVAIKPGKAVEAGSSDGVSGRSRSSAVIEEVIVTAQKREQSLHDVPISITAMGAEELAKKGIDNFDDLKFVAPAIGMYEEAPGRQNVFLRGIGTFIGNEPLVSTYIDDSPGDTGSSTGAVAVISQTFPLQFDDLERVEVLRGPQGTLYGSGAVGGTIRYITKDPQLDRFGAGGDVTLSFTEDGDPSQRAAAIINLPVVKGEFGLRVASTFDRSGGYIDAPGLNWKDINNQDMQQVRVKVLWQPSERFDTRAMIIVHRNESDVGTNIGDADLNLVIFPSELVPDGLSFHDKAEHYNLSLNYDAGFARLLSSSTYINRDMYSIGWLRGTDLTLFPGITSFSGTDALNDVFTQEIRATSADASSPLSWTVGGIYRDRTAKTANGKGVFTNGNIVIPSDLPGINSELKTQSWAAFADAGYKFFDRLELGAGIRYFEDDRDFTSFVTGQMDSVNFDATTWRVYASYDVTDTVKVYTNVGTGFRSGGSNVSNLAVLQGFGPETLTSYEAGIKMSFLDGRLNGDAAFFYSEYDDMFFRSIFLIGGVGPAVSIVDNVGFSEVKGVEGRLNWQLTDHLFLYINGAVTDNEIVKLSSDTVTATNVGDPLNYAPEYTFSTGGEYRFDWSMDVPGFVRVDYNRRGKSFFVERGSSSNIGESDVIGLLNARIGADWERWRFELFANNLLDENGTAGPTGDLWSSAPRLRPRTFGIKVGVDFE